MKTFITLLVDASQSMGKYTKETQESIVSLIKGADQDSYLKLVFFDRDQYQIVANDKISNIAPELGYLFRSRGWTPITDSIHKSINDIVDTVTDIRQLNEKHKFVIFTDGEENTLRYTTKEALGGAIQHMTENFGWDFQFIGPKSCESGVKQYTDSIKIKKENVTLYSDMSEGLKAMENQVVNA